MLVYIDKYTPNDSRTHDTSSWFIYDTPDVSGVVAPIHEVLDSTDNLLSLKIPLGLLNKKLYVVVRRNMSDGTYLQPKTYVVEDITKITPTMDAYVAIPSIKVISNALDSGGVLSLIGSQIEPAYNVLEEAYWSILVDGKTTTTKKVSNLQMVTFTADEVNLNGSTDLQATLVYRSLEGVSSHSALTTILSNEDTTTIVYGKNSIDPMDTFDVRLSNNADILSILVSDNSGKVIFHSLDSKIPSALLSYATHYRLVVNYTLSGVFKMVDTTIKTVSDQNKYEIDLSYVYSTMEPSRPYSEMLGTFLVDEALGGFILRPNEEICMNIDINKGGEKVFSLPHTRFKDIDFTKDYRIRNVNNHMFLLENDISVSIYDMVQDIRSFYMIKETIIDAISNVTSHNGYFYYVNSLFKIVRLAYRGGDPEPIADIPSFLKPSDGVYGIESVDGYLYITGPLDALLRMKISSLDFDYLQMLPAQNLTELILLKNNDFILITDDKMSAFKYNFKDDSMSPFILKTEIKGIIRNLDGGVIFIYTDGTAETYK